MKKIVAILFLSSFLGFSQEIALLKYSGGGDWYANPTSLPNLIQFCNQNIKTTIKSKPVTVSIESSEITAYPFIHMTGHGNVVISPNEATNLRNYLLSGGFLHIDFLLHISHFFINIGKDIRNAFFSC